MHTHKSHRRRTRVALTGLVVFVLTLNLVFLLSSPEELVQHVGIENSYLLVFLIASLGGLSAFSSPILYASIATFAAGGASPWLLGLSGGLGIALGDILLFLLFTAGRATAERVLAIDLTRFASWRERVPFPLQILLLYGLLGFTPIPNDIVMAALSLLRFRLRTVAPLVVATGITLATLTAFGGSLFLSTTAN